MQIAVKFFKVIGLPSEPVADAFYFVADEEETVVEIWLTNQDGVAKNVGSTGLILALLLWENIANKPATFPASAHNHNDLYLTEAETTSAIAAAIAALVDSSPATLDTLNELAAALGDNPNFATTITNALAAKQTLDADLTAIAGLDSSTAGAIASDGGGWIKKTYAQFKTALGLVKADVGLGNVDNTTDAGKPVSTAQQAALDLKAPLADAALTGNPTAPNQAGGTNNTRIANTAFVSAAIANLINSAPGALDTLDELAAAFGDDPNFAATVAAAPALKAPLASPTFTGPVTIGANDYFGIGGGTTYVAAVGGDLFLGAGGGGRLIIRGVAGDPEVTIAGAGLILKSPNGLVRARITINNAGALVTTVI